MSVAVQLNFNWCYHFFDLYLYIYTLQAVGVRFGFLIEIIVTFITAITVALYFSWSLTLLILGFMPFMIISMIFRGYIVTGETTSSKRGYEESSYVSSLPYS